MSGNVGTTRTITSTESRLRGIEIHEVFSNERLPFLRIGPAFARPMPSSCFSVSACPSLAVARLIACHHVSKARELGNTRQPSSNAASYFSQSATNPFALWWRPMPLP